MSFLIMLSINSIPLSIILFVYVDNQKIIDYVPISINNYKGMFWVVTKIWLCIRYPCNSIILRPLRQCAKESLVILFHMGTTYVLVIIIIIEKKPSRMNLTTKQKELHIYQQFRQLGFVYYFCKVLFFVQKSLEE